MRIVHWGDFNCPYSYIGLNRLKNALNEFDLDVEWKMKSFELEPELSGKSVITTAEMYSKKYGITLADAELQIDEIEEIAREDGLEINYRQITSSKDAHRLVKYAQNRHPQVAQRLIEEIFKSNFEKNEVISSHDVLIKIAASLGLDKDKVKEMLLSDSYGIEVDLDLEDALLNGITFIPCYALYCKDERLIIPGVFEKEDFEIAIEDLLSGDIKNKTFL